MAYTTIDDPSAYFHIQLYTGNNNTTQSITNNANSGDFQADWLWIKNRDNVEKHHLMDSSRGANKFLHSNEDAAERTGSHASGHNDINSFSSNGFTITSNGSNDELNFGTRTYVAWQWKANGGTTANNTDGTITSTVQANTTAGFSIVTYTGNGSTGATIGHGLGAVPSMFIIKRRSGTEDWVVYHHKNTSAPETDHLLLNTTDATADSDTRFNDTAPTSTLITMGNNAVINASGSTYVGYAFAEKQGYSKFGSYTGNANADGPFVYTGFKPSFLMIRNTVNGEDWLIWDVKRDIANASGNPMTGRLKANATIAEVNGNDIDFLSNGFKIRTDSTYGNGSGHTIVYFAFAESPFVSSEGVPTTAR